MAPSPGSFRRRCATSADARKRWWATSIAVAVDDGLERLALSRWMMVKMSLIQTSMTTTTTVITLPIGVAVATVAAESVTAPSTVSMPTAAAAAFGPALPAKTTTTTPTQSMPTAAQLHSPNVAATRSQPPPSRSSPHRPPPPLRALSSAVPSSCHRPQLAATVAPTPASCRAT